ncbi:MAG TPA: ISNCY family transposase [Candidatus Nanopelagicaceae bacterium]|nr:ISNCY family transposase [Candidatus Nanopelagicaceae bacterium]
MTTSEQRRLVVLNHLASGALVNAEAARLLEISVRQLQRMKAAYAELGAAALSHGNRGRKPAHALDPELMRRVVELATTTYVGFNRQHLTEMLTEEHELIVSRPSVHRILAAAGIPAPRQRRAPRHRRRRDRYPQAGMLLQVDTSRHDWLEGRGPWLSLVGAIDDATSEVLWARFREQEDAQGYFEVMREVVRRRGIPLALYADRHSIFVVTKNAHLTLEEELAGRRQPTQFGRLLDELGVNLILARSPQAKGRIERLWGTFQDRLVSELRLAHACTSNDANQVLQRCLARHNRRFMVAPQDPAPAWLPWPKSSRLEEFFCFKYRRVVANDNTVRFGSHVIDIPRTRDRQSQAHARVEVHERFDGTLCVYSGGFCLAKKVLADPKTIYRAAAHSHAGELTPVPVISNPKPQPPANTSGPYRPPANHPWRRPSVTTP